MSSSDAGAPAPAKVMNAAVLLPSSSSSSSSASSASSPPVPLMPAGFMLPPAKALPPLNFVTEWNVSLRAIELSTPSRADGIGFAEEAAFRARCCEQSKQLLAGVEEGLQRHRNPQRQEVAGRLAENVVRIRAIAMALLHRFFTYVSVRGFKDRPTDTGDVVAACCFLACKLEDIEMRASFVTDIQWKETVPFGGTPTEQQREEWQRRMFKREVEVLKVCAFQLNFQLPFALLSAKTRLATCAVTGLPARAPAAAGTKKKPPDPRKTLMTLARQAAADAFHTVACVVYGPHELAAAAVYLASVVVRRNAKLGWDAHVDFDVLTGRFGHNKDGAGTGRAQQQQQQHERGAVSATAIAGVCRLVLQLDRWRQAKWFPADGAESLLEEVLVVAAAQDDGGGSGS